MTDTPRIDELRRRVEADPASFAFAALAEEYRRAGRFADAVSTCRAGLQKHPSYVSARATLGRSLIELGDLAAARAELEQVLRSAPQHLGALRGLAEVSRRHGDLADAIARLRTAAQLAPQDRGLLDQLAALEAAGAPSASSRPAETAGPDPRRARQLAALDRVLAVVKARRPGSHAPTPELG